MLRSLSEYILLIPAIIIAMSVHEAAHAYSAYYYGDDTAQRYGRLTLNPFAHIDWLGFLLLLVAGFGWAKPVPVNPANFKGNIRVADFVVSVAGITVNFITAVIALFILTHVSIGNEGLSLFLEKLAQISIVLAAFNILPIPPLDGSKMLAAILPGKAHEIIWFLDRYGMFILLLLMFTGAFSIILGPVIRLFLSLALSIATLF